MTEDVGAENGGSESCVPGLSFGLSKPASFQPRLLDLKLNVQELQIRRDESMQS